MLRKFRCDACEKGYVHNIFTINHRWLAIISYNLNLSLKLLFAPPITPYNNLPLKICCESVMKMLWTQHFSMLIYVTYKHTQPRTHNQMAKSLIAKLAPLTSRFQIPHPLTIALSKKKKKTTQSNENGFRNQSGQRTGKETSLQFSSPIKVKLMVELVMS